MRKVRVRASLRNEREGSEITVAMTINLTGSGKLSLNARRTMRELGYNLITAHPEMQKEFCGKFHGSPANIEYHVSLVTKAQSRREAFRHYGKNA